MRKFLIVAALTIAVLASATTRADAQTIGPICFKSNLFSDIFVGIYNFHGPNHLVGTGRNVNVGGVLSTTIVLVGGTAVLGIHAMTPPTGNNHAFDVSANLALGPLSGPGKCEAFNTGTGGCSTGTAITMGVVSCPAGAIDGVFAAPDAVTLENSMGAVRSPEQ